MRGIAAIRKAFLSAAFLLNAVVTFHLLRTFLARYMQTREPADPWLLSAFLSALAALSFGAYCLEALSGAVWPRPARAATRAPLPAPDPAAGPSPGPHPAVSRSGRKGIMTAWAVFLPVQCAAIGWFRTMAPCTVPAHLAMCCLALTFTYPLVPALAFAASCTTASSLALFLQGEAAAGGGCLAVFAAAAMGKLLLELMVRDWNEQFSMADQARWAATEFAVANLRLQRSLTDSETESAQRERSRIAREIHDTVGYALTGILVQLRAAREISSVQPEKTSAILEGLEPMVGSALEDVRREVAALRERKPLSIGWQAKLGLLCGSFSQCTGTRVNLDMPEDSLPLREDAGEAVFRIVQESLTNAIRHGRASFIDVKVVWKREERKLLLRISDNGRGAAHVHPGSGLAGILERVRFLGGEVAWETRPEKGFDLGVALPLTGSAA